MPFAGIAADRLSKAHRDKLMALIDLYLGNINDDHSKIKLDEVRSNSPMICSNTTLSMVTR